MEWSIQLSAFAPIPERRGQCYVYAYQWVDAHPEWNLVHGYLNGEAVRQHGVRYDHAWAMFGTDVIYEPLVDKAFEYDEYAGMTEPVALHIYNVDQMRQLAALSGNYGPWVRSQRRAVKV